MVQIIPGVLRRMMQNGENQRIPEELIAIDSYTPAAGRGMIPFIRGDRFLLESDDPNANWCYVRQIGSGRRGFAPSSFLAKASDIPNLEWISFDINREEAEETLEGNQYSPGSFIIRKRPDKNISQLLSLSLKVEKSPEKFGVVHFQILRHGGAFRVDKSTDSFDTLGSFVKYYAGRHNKSTLRLTFSVEKQKSVIPWEYEAEEIEQLQLLGRGYFGEVFLGTHFSKKVALKTPDPMRMDPEDFMKEVEVSRYCNHPNVLETFGVCHAKLYIITEYLPNGDLQNYIRKLPPNGKLSPVQCLSVALKIACAMEYLSGMKIVHRDLSARNVLVGKTIDTIKVADFGLSRNLQTSPYYITSREAFPRGWTAPEAFVIFQGIIPSKMGEVTIAADVWSYGVVLWELYSDAQEPYHNIPPHALYGLLKEQNYRLALPQKCPSTVYAKMLECWNINRKERPNFTDIRSFLSQHISGNEVEEKTRDLQQLLHIFLPHDEMVNEQRDEDMFHI